jgi:hypothetical protein
MASRHACANERMNHDLQSLVAGLFAERQNRAWPRWHKHCRCNPIACSGPRRGTAPGSDVVEAALSGGGRMGHPQRHPGTDAQMPRVPGSLCGTIDRTRAFVLSGIVRSDIAPDRVYRLAALPGAESSGPLRGRQDVRHDEASVSQFLRGARGASKCDRSWSCARSSWSESPSTTSTAT